MSCDCLGTTFTHILSVGGSEKRTSILSALEQPFIMTLPARNILGSCDRSMYLANDTFPINQKWFGLVLLCHWADDSHSHEWQGWWLPTFIHWRHFKERTCSWLAVTRCEWGRCARVCVYRGWRGKQISLFLEQKGHTWKTQPHNSLIPPTPCCKEAWMVPVLSNFLNLLYRPKLSPSKRKKLG